MRRFAPFLGAVALALVALNSHAVPVSWGGPYASVGGICGGVVHTYVSGSGATETVPAGCTSAVITGDGGGGAGACTSSGGGGGGGSGRFVKTISVTGGNTFTYSVGARGLVVGCPANGAGGGSTVVTGTVSGGSVSLVAAGGAGAVGSGAGTGGGASGGDTNTSGSAGQTHGAGGLGGTAASGALNGMAPGAGGAGGSVTEVAFPGAQGQIIFAYS